MNAVGKVALGGLGLSAVGLGTRLVPTLLDSKKGSLTNRADCAQEHIKNDLKTGVQLGLPAAGVAVVAMKKPEVLTKVATETGKYAGKIGKWLASKMPKGGFGTGILNKVLKNPTKAGVIGLIAAGGLYVLNKLVKHAENYGRIEQKYNDTGAIENATKNLVLNA
jgi:hypothetical protein